MDQIHPKIDPDTTKCRTSKVGAVIPGTVQEMYYCGIDNGDCRYAMSLGWDYICKHSDNKNFSCSDSPENEVV
jgi:hypothetical protein